MQIFYGYFEHPDAPPEHSPPHDGPCLFCGKKLEPDDVRTFSLMMVEKAYAQRSYFYSVHRSCSESRNEKDHLVLDEIIFGMIRQNGD